MSVIVDTELKSCGTWKYKVPSVFSSEAQQQQQVGNPCAEVLSVYTFSQRGEYGYPFCIFGGSGWKDF